MSGKTRRLGAVIVSAVLSAAGTHAACASDHLDTAAVVASPAADIADLFAWTSSDGRRLNLAMTLVAHEFSDHLLYVFHVDSAAGFAETAATTSIACRFDAAQVVECWAGEADYTRGDASKPAGLEGKQRRFRVFAGLRDDPFFNNVKGTRAALGAAGAALQAKAAMDGAGCPRVDAGTSKTILDRWRQTDGGTATNFLVGWKAASLVISIDLDVVNTGGKLLAVWSAIYASDAHGAPGGTVVRPPLGVQIDRVGRPLIANALLGLFAPDDVSDRRKGAYNERASPPEWSEFVAEIQQTLGLYDGIDGTCGNQWLADRAGDTPNRYRVLANLLADDRLWIDSESTVCTQFLGVERGETPYGVPNGDCGGRTPNYDAVDVFRSLLILGVPAGVGDGVEHDDRVHSTSEFPFLAAP